MMMINDLNWAVADGQIKIDKRKASDWADSHKPAPCHATIAKTNTTSLMFLYLSLHLSLSLSNIPVLGKGHPTKTLPDDDHYNDDDADDDDDEPHLAGVCLKNFHSFPRTQHATVLQTLTALHCTHL